MRARTVVITGASSGVGRACSRAFAQKGRSVALVARNEAALKEAAREVEANGARALILPADVSSASDVEDVAAAVEAELGAIDVWVNNAMVSVFSPVWDTTAEEFERVTAVNYLGTVHGTLAALARMRERNAGVIVQVGSGLAYRAIPLQAAYCATKHAVRAFTESVRTELLHDGSAVRITIVQLPGLNTPHFLRARSRMPTQVRPVPPIYSPELAARAVVYAARHPERRELVVGGVTSALLLAQKLAPGVVDRYLARTGVKSQSTGIAVPQRDGNLFETLPGDPGVTGPFVARAHDRSLQFAISRRRRLIAAAGLAGAALWRARRA